MDPPNWKSKCDVKVLSLYEETNSRRENYLAIVISQLDVFLHDDDVVICLNPFSAFQINLFMPSSNLQSYPNSEANYLFLEKKIS